MAFFSNLRVRLILLVILALLPAFVVVIYSNFEGRRQNLSDAETDALRLARLAAGEQESVINATQLLLVTLAQLPQLRQVDPAACEPLLDNLLKRYPFYTGITVASPAGDVLCSAPAIHAPLNYSDRAWFQTLVATKGLTTSDYQIGRISGKPALILAYPILGDTGQPEAVVTAGIDLSWLGQIAQSMQLPSGAALILLDSRGTIMARYPEPEKWVGQAFPESSIAKTILSGQDQGSAKVPGVDGVPRLYAWTVLHAGAPTRAYVSIGIPTQVAYAIANEALFRNLTLLGLAAMLSLGAAWIAGDAFVLRQVSALLAATQRLAAGDLGARSGARTGSREIAQLARAFDEMAQNLQQRQAELEQQNRELGALYHTAHATAQLLNLDQLLGEGLAQVLDVLDVEAGRIYLLEPDGETMTLRSESGHSAEFLRKVERIKLGEGVSGRAAAERQPIVLDVQHYPTERLAPLMLQEGFATVASTPLLSRGVLLGTLNLATCRIRAFPPDQLELLAAIGQQLGAAVHNARLYQQAQTEIAERARAEQALQVYATRLEQSNRDLQDFAYVSSHDLQEPLRKIQAFGDRLKTKHADALGDEGRDYVERMQNAAGRMQTLINDLLAYSRVTTRGQAFAPTDLGQVAREVLSDLEIRIRESNGTVSLGDLPTIDADPTQMHQLIQNLIANAVKFHRPAVDPVVNVSSRTTQGPEGKSEWCEITVEDNGIGFDVKYVDRIFQPFQRLHAREEFEGTGIGLAICRKIADRHGGTIRAESKPGQGAKFIVTLPVRQARLGES